MNNFEQNHLIEEEQAIARHEITPKNRNENQIRLATDLFEYVIGSKIDLEDVHQKNDVMEYWVDEDFSRIYRQLEQDEIFLDHSRLQGNIFKITVEDIIQYKKDGTLSE